MDGAIDVVCSRCGEWSNLYTRAIDLHVVDGRSPWLEIGLSAPIRRGIGVPMGRIPWDIGEPGHFEVDLLHHSGESTAGLYGHSIQLVDMATGWSERVGSWDVDQRR
jgi:hypothetical protein